MSKRNFKRCLEADKKTANLNKLSLLNQTTTNCEYFDVSQDQYSANVCNPLTAAINL